MSRFVCLTLLKIDTTKDRLVEKKVLLLAESISTMEPDVLTFKDSITPVTFIQAAVGSLALGLNVKETMEQVEQLVTAAIPPTMYYIPPSPVR